MDQESRPLLEGVRVLDLSRVLAGPYCTMLLGDLGADVIKVEVPGRGDDTRHWGPPFAEGGESAYYLCANRNKRSMTLNLKSERGLSILRDLIQQSDILIENFRVGTLEGWGLSYEELRSLNSGLIYCTITGYGYTGPYRDKPGYDFMVQAQGGVMSITGPVDGEPFKVGVAIVDIAAGLFACNAILASLFARQQTREGQRIDISLLDSQVAWLANVASNFLISGENPKRYGNAHPNIVPYETFKASDGYFALGVGNDLQWKKLCVILGKNSWAEDKRFATNADRVMNREVLVNLLADLFKKQDVAHWLSQLETNGIPVAPINSIDQVFEDPQVLSREMKLNIHHPTAGLVPLVGSPLKIPTAPVKFRLPPPELGEHTIDILTEILNYELESVDELRKMNVI
jgi:formyl-CoA transferase